MNLRFLRTILWVLLICLGSYLGYATFQDTRNELSDTRNLPDIGGAFTAVSTRGEITHSDMLGRPHLLFFGYTHCPDFCPTTLTFASSWLDDLGTDGDKLDIYFVTIDPARDTPDKLRDYLTHFDPRIIGISGTQSQIDTITSAWRVYAEAEEDGLFSHSVTTFLMDSTGRFVSTIGYGEDSATAISKLRKLVSS